MQVQRTDCDDKIKFYTQKSRMPPAICFDLTAMSGLGLPYDERMPEVLVLQDLFFISPSLI